MPNWISKETQDLFPDLNPGNAEKISEIEPRYNCIAFAAGDTHRWWEPPIDGILDPGQYWPKGAPENLDLSSYIKAYELHGFVRHSECAIGQDFEKIALYAYDDDEIAHAAKLNQDGSWASKLGKREDIRHDYLSSLEGEAPRYGYVRLLMGRLDP